MKSNSFLLRQLWLQQEDFRWIALVWGAAFLIVAAIEAIVCPLLSEEGAIIPIASLLGLVVGPILMVVFGMVRFTTEFGIGLQMGSTRRQMVAAELWLCLCQNAEMLVLELLTILLESTLLPLLRGVPAYLTPEDYVGIAAGLPGWLIPALFFGLLAVEFLGGAMINRFGAKGLWPFWALCICLRWEMQAVQWLWPRLGMALVWGSLALLAVGLFAAAHSLLHRSTAQI